MPMSLIDKLLGHQGQKGMAGIYDDEHDVVEAARKVYQAGFRKFDVISPYPLHHVDEAINLPRSWIPWVTFTFGLTGFLFGVWFTWWTSAVDYPLNIGGKPMWSIPAFVPVIFECTILLAALSSVGAMIAANGLPKHNPPVIDPALSSHKFGIFIPENDNGYDRAKIDRIFRETGAGEIKLAEF